MGAWVVANEEQQHVEMIWSGNLIVALCVELGVFFLYFLTTLLIGSLLWSYSRLLEGFCFIKRKLDEGNLVNLGVLLHPEHGDFDREQAGPPEMLCDELMDENEL